MLGQQFSKNNACSEKEFQDGQEMFCGQLPRNLHNACRSQEDIAQMY
jgi:hypothetical protein